jgi:AraC family transcriptional regulator
MNTVTLWTTIPVAPSTPATAMPTGLAPTKLARVLSFIDEHLGEPLPIVRLASVVCMSPFHFARLFKRATGQPPHGYLTARRVERAKELLRNDGLPLVHIAFSVGFQTQGHFTEVFHRYAGLTPRRFRLSATRPAAAVSRSVTESAVTESAVPESAPESNSNPQREGTHSSWHS